MSSNSHTISFTETDDGSIEIESHLADNGPDKAFSVMLAIQSIIIDIDLEAIKELAPNTDEAALKIYRTRATLGQ